MKTVVSQVVIFFGLSADIHAYSILMMKSSILTSSEGEANIMGGLSNDQKGKMIYVPSSTLLYGYNFVQLRLHIFIIQIIIACSENAYAYWLAASLLVQGITWAGFIQCTKYISGQRYTQHHQLTRELKQLQHRFINIIARYHPIIKKIMEHE